MKGLKERVLWKRLKGRWKGLMESAGGSARWEGTMKRSDGKVWRKGLDGNLMERSMEMPGGKV
jgi:hypothetical protein